MKEGDVELYSWGVDVCGPSNFAESNRTYPLPRLSEIKVALKRVACGEDFSLLLTVQGQVFAMGSNADGRLGLNDRALRNKPTPCLIKALADFKVIQISCGWGHSAALTAEGRVYSWGIGARGALGTGTTDTEWRPVHVRVPGKATYIDCGARHTGIVLSNDLYICGAGDSGQLGTGKRDQVLTPNKVQINGHVTAVACGLFHTLILTKQGKVHAMGGNNYGQLGTGDKQGSLVPIEVKTLKGIAQVACCHFSAAVSDQGDLLVWGTGVFGEFLTPRTVTNIPTAVKEVRLGSCFAAALDSQGKLWTWGSNSSGELGLGDYEPRANPTCVEELPGHVSRFDCGNACVYVIVQSEATRPLRRDNSALRLSQLATADQERSSSRLGSQPEIIVSYRSHGSSSPRQHPEIRPLRPPPDQDIGRPQITPLDRDPSRTQVPSLNGNHGRPPRQLPVESISRPLRAPPVDIGYLEGQLSKERLQTTDLQGLTEDLQQQLRNWEKELRPLEDENIDLKQVVADQDKRIVECEALLAEKDLQSQRLLERIRELERLAISRNEADISQRNSLAQMQEELRLRARDYKDRTIHRLRASPRSMRSDTTSVSSPILHSIPTSPRLALSPRHMAHIAREAEETTYSMAARQESQAHQYLQGLDHSSRLLAKHAALHEGSNWRQNFRGTQSVGMASLGDGLPIRATQPPKWSEKLLSTR